MVVYAIKIGRKYFKEYVYAGKDTRGRYAGNTGLGTAIQEGDIVDVVLTDEPQRTETVRGIGNTIAVLYGIEKLKAKEIRIIPVIGG